MSRVLIVDDAYFMRSLIKRTVIEAGHEVVGEAKNGKEALQLYRELKPDIVTMDIKMPEMSGIEATKQILSEDKNAKIIAVTGNNKDDLKQEMLNAGAKDYLRKPFQPAFLLKKIDQLLQNEIDEIQEAVKTQRETTNNIVENNEKKVVVSSDEVIDDFFDDIEIELLNKPDPSKEKEIIITNDEDHIEFPEDYPLEEEMKKHALTNKINEEEIETDQEMDFELSSMENLEKTILQSEQDQTIDHIDTIKSPPKTSANNLQSINEPFRNESQYEISKEIDSKTYSSQKEYDTPIQIRPPKIDLYETNAYKVDEDLDEDEDFVIDATSSTSQTSAPPSHKENKLTSFLKNLFKI